ncbi:hypothetical protein AB0H83_29700 [Dactylosporangium sp. NPDC050688]|uniref:hypothetical protein n=1 Tax=Dactylosporangium sp. NPDC050688 TaxID=3157217 RepID=UPI0033FC93C5
MTANDCVQAFAAAHHAEFASNQQIHDAELVGERTGSAGVRAASASERYSAITDYADALLRLWARQALHLARIAAAVAHTLHTGDARIGADNLRLADVAAVSTLYVTPHLLAAPPFPADNPSLDAPTAASLAAAHQRVSAALRVAGEHNTPPHVFDADLPDIKESITALGLLDLAEALHDYGAHALWLVATHTVAR